MNNIFLVSPFNESSTLIKTIQDIKRWIRPDVVRANNTSSLVMVLWKPIRTAIEYHLVDAMLREKKEHEGLLTNEPELEKKAKKIAIRMAVDLKNNPPENLIEKTSKALYYQLNPNESASYKDFFIDLRELKDGSVIGVQKNISTFGLYYGITPGGIEGRFCYEQLEDCYAAFLKADLLNHEHIPDDDDWLVHKGKTQFRNPERNSS